MNRKIRVCAAALTAVLTVGSVAGASDAPDAVKTEAKSLKIGDIAEIAMIDVFGESRKRRRKYYAQRVAFSGK